MPEPIGIPKDANGGIPKWLMIGGGIVAAVALYALSKKQQSGGSTVAAGTSINAALGSLQEQILQTQGEIGTSAAQTNNNIGELSTQLQQDVAGLAAGQQSATDQANANWTALFAPGGTDGGRVQGWMDAAVTASSQSNASFDAAANTAAQLTAATTGTH